MKNKSMPITPTPTLTDEEDVKEFLECIKRGLSLKISPEQKQEMKDLRDKIIAKSNHLLS